MKQWFAVLAATIIFWQVSTTLVAAEDVPTTTDAPVTTEAAIPETTLEAVAGKDRVAVVGRNVLFDGSGSAGPLNAALSYTWDFGDGQKFEGIDASHIYSEPGVYHAHLTVTDGTSTSHDNVTVTVARDVTILLTDDQSVSKDDLRTYKQTAQRAGVLLVVISATSTDSDYLAERNLTDQLIASLDDVAQANVIFSITQKSIGLNALVDMHRILSSDNTAAGKVSFGQKVIVQANSSLSGGAFLLLAQSAFDTIQPRDIIVTTTSSIKSLIGRSDSTAILNQLQNDHSTYQRIGLHSERALGELTPINFLSYGINYLVNKGVSPDDLFLLLILPIVATIVSFARQVLGIKAFGILVPTIMTLTFVVTQLKYGLAIFLVLIVTATLARIAARYLRLLYLPRMAIVLTVVSLAIFVMFIFAGYTHRTAFLSISIFPILMMIMLTESFVETQIEQGNRAAIVITLETLALTIISYFIVTWSWFETLIMSYPELVLLTVVINILLGRFTGLRLSEYFRFKSLLKKTNER